MLFQPVGDLEEFREGFRHHLFKRRLVGTGRNACFFGDVLRRADTGNNVFTLRID